MVKHAGITHKGGGADIEAALQVWSHKACIPKTNYSFLYMPLRCGKQIGLRSV